MKKISKLLTLMLAVLMVIMTVGPVTPAKAATKVPTLSKATRTIYVGGSSVQPSHADGTYILKVTNRPSKYSVTWTTSNKNVATVKAADNGTSKYRGEVTAIKAGTAVITATVRDKSVTPNVAYSLSCKVTVLKNCSSIQVSGVPTAGLEVGKTAQLTGTMYNNKGAVAAKGEITDTMKWESSDTSVATVDKNGLVTALSEGTTYITCYTVQSTTGMYSQLENATCSQRVKLTCKSSAIEGINSVKQVALNAVEINFGKDFSKVITKDNGKLLMTLLGSQMPISSIKFDSTGKKATVTATTDFIKGYEYTFTLSGTDATKGTTAKFTAAKGDPVRMELYVEGSNNLVACNKEIPLRFRLFDANGLDITPAFGSTQYQNYANNIYYETETTSGNWYVDSDAKTIYFTNEGDTAVVKATYLEYNPTTYSDKAICTCYGYFTSVNEASTISFKGATIAKSTDLGELVDWDKTSNFVREYDETYKLIARVMDGTGEYKYSTDYDSLITFRSNSNTSLFVAEGGALFPIARGSDAVTVYYGAPGYEEPIGSIVVTVKEARQAVAMRMTDPTGKVVTSMTLSDVFGVSEGSAKLTVYDQDGLVLPVNDYEFETAMTLTNAYGPVMNVSGNDDGTVTLTVDGAGHGTTAGKTYPYQVLYTNSVYGSTSIRFNVRITTPNANLATTYKAEIEGTTDMMCSGTMSELPTLRLKLYEMKGGIKYDKADCIYSAVQVGTGAAENSYVYRLYNAAGTELNNSGANSGLLKSDEIDIVRPYNGVLQKLPTGTYTVKIYQLVGASKTQTLRTSIQFKLTDSQKNVTIDQLSNTSTRDMSTNMSEGEMLDIFDECFRVMVGDEEIPANQITLVDPVKSNNAVFFRTITIEQQILAGGGSYTISSTLKINKTINHVNYY